MSGILLGMYILPKRWSVVEQYFGWNLDVKEWLTTTICFTKKEIKRIESTPSTTAHTNSLVFEINAPREPSKSDKTTTELCYDY